jgi:plasmid stabilization system protein ParE
MSGPRVISAAHHDVVETVEYLFEKDVDLAEDFIARVEDAYRKIGETPNATRVSKPTRPTGTSAGFSFSVFRT